MGITTVLRETADPPSLVYTRLSSLPPLPLRRPHQHPPSSSSPSPRPHHPHYTRTTDQASLPFPVRLLPQHRPLPLKLTRSRSISSITSTVSSSSLSYPSTPTATTCPLGFNSGATTPKLSKHLINGSNAPSNSAAVTPPCSIVLDSFEGVVPSAGCSSVSTLRANGGPNCSFDSLLTFDVDVELDEDVEEDVDDDVEKQPRDHPHPHPHLHLHPHPPPSLSSCSPSPSLLASPRPKLLPQPRPLAFKQPCSTRETHSHVQFVVSSATHAKLCELADDHNVGSLHKTVRDIVRWGCENCVDEVDIDWLVSMRLSPSPLTSPSSSTSSSTSRGKDECHHENKVGDDDSRPNGAYDDREDTCNHDEDDEDDIRRVISKHNHRAMVETPMKIQSTLLLPSSSSLHSDSDSDSDDDDDINTTTKKKNNTLTLHARLPSRLIHWLDDVQSQSDSDDELSITEYHQRQGFGYGILLERLVCAIWDGHVDETDVFDYTFCRKEEEGGDERHTSAELYYDLGLIANRGRGFCQ